MKLRTTIAVAAVLILAASCTSGTEGIFASIEREQKIVSLGGLSKYATVTSMAESGGTYYATGGKALFSRPVAGTTWDKSSVAGNTEVQAVGSTSSDIFAVAGGGLYRMVGGTWTAVAISGGETAYDLVPIRGDDGYSTTELLLVTSVGSPAKRNVVYRINGTTLTALDLSVSAGMDLGAPVRSAVFDETNYYLASPSFLWQVPSSFASATKVVVSGAPTSEYSGLLYLATGDLLYLSTTSVGTNGGGLYSAASRGTSITFTALANGTNVKAGSSSTYPVAFGQFLYNLTNSSLWVATGATVGQEGNGYMEITGTSFSQTPTTDSNNYTSSAIKTYNVATLFKGSSGYFLGTVAHGLWTWDSTKKTWGQQ